MQAAAAFQPPSPITYQAIRDGKCGFAGYEAPDKAKGDGDTDSLTARIHIK
jgi:hypothetical protein